MSDRKTIVIEGDLDVLRDWLAGGQFYQISIGDTDLLSEIEREWLGLMGGDQLQDGGAIETRTGLGLVRITIEPLRGDHD